MAIQLESKKEKKLKAKGIFDRITDEGLVIVDSKKGEQLLKFEMLKQFIGNEITFSISQKSEV